MSSSDAASSCDSIALHINGSSNSSRGGLMAKPLDLYHATIQGPIGSDICDRSTWSPSIAQSLPPTELPSGQQLHARCMQLASQQGRSSTAQYSMWTTLPMRLTFSPWALALVAVRTKDKNHLFGITSPTTHLGSWHPFPPAHTSIVQHSDLLPVRRSPSSELSLTSADRQSPLATRGYGVTTRGRSDQEVCGVDHSSRCLMPCLPSPSRTQCI